MKSKFLIMVPLVAVIAAVTAFGWVRHDRLPADAVLRYAGHTVTKTELDERINVISALYGVRRPTGTKEAIFQRDAAKSMAVSMILDNETKRRGIVIGDKQARDELTKLIAAQMSGSETAFTQFLADNGISEDDVLFEIKEQLATSELAQQVTGTSPPVTAADARAFFDAHKSQMKSDASRHLLNIVVATEATAARVADQARTGVDFAKLARQWSQDGSTKQKGGDLGTVTLAQLEADYGKAAFGAAAGQVFGPVRTQYGWNVGKVVGIVAPAPVAFATVEQQLVTGLENQAKLKLWNDFLSDLLKHADVTYAAGYRPGDPTALPSALATGFGAGN